MFGMKFAIDVVYLNRDFEMVKLIKCLKPWEVSFSLKGKHVLEMPKGSIDKHKLLLGEKLLIKGGEV